MVEIEDLQYRWTNQNSGPHVKYVLEKGDYKASVGVYLIGGPQERYQIGSEVFVAKGGVLKEVLRGHILCDDKDAGQWYLTEEMCHLERVIEREVSVEKARRNGNQ